MQNKYFLILNLIFSFNLFFGHFLTAKETEEESFTVKLTTDSSLIPLYILPIENNQTSLSESYIRQLENILSFDLNYNGSTTIVKRKTEYDRLGQKSSSNQLGSAQDWKDRHIFYVIKSKTQDQSFTTLLLDVQNQSLKSTEPFLLTGDLALDRLQVHKLADTIHKTLFNKEGIATTHVLYTIKTGDSPDSTKWISEVWECDYDGANARKLTQERSYCVTPVYLPPKPGYVTGGFLYVSYQLGQPKIFISALKDKKSFRLSSLKGNQFMPAISQQRDKVAFICDITGNPDLFVQDFNAEKGAIDKPQQVFSARLSTQGSPTFSPDGSQIAFVSDKDGSPKIYVLTIPAPGAALKDIKATLISKKNRENSAPSWSPDGTKIAYCARNKEERQIWVYDFNTGQEMQVTKGPGHKENPSWAPNSLHLVFNTSDPKSSELFIVNLNQLEAKQITFGSGEKRFPNWEPRFY